MNKSNVLQAIIATLEVQYQTAIDAAKEAHKTATDDETIAENKYDTFALEASYLAHGQSQRVLDCENNLRLFKTFPIKHFLATDVIDVGALVALTKQNAEACGTQMKHYFIGPSCGGLQVTVGNMDYMVISPQSALGQTLIGKYLDDEVRIPVAGQLIDYDITEIC
ncbi:transcription elongation factor [Marinomonas agarivorans]|nr:transcription elongation factor [Marinomonas agarivorans]